MKIKRKDLDLGPVATKWFNVTVTLTGAQMVELKVFLTALRHEPNRRRFAEKMLPPRGRTPTSEECKRLDALVHVEQALVLPREVSDDQAHRRLELLRRRRGGLPLPAPK
jgi:hypothetical protein